VTFEPITAKSANVIGAILGSDAKLREEYVVYTAHLDDLGIGPPVGGDSIYNGAMDNAAGVAGLIEIARAFKSLPAAPRRSILFVATTAEDAGLIGMLGADYFAQHPTVPRASIVANINLDGLPIFFDFRDVVAYGAEHSTLEAPLRQAASMLGLELIPDPWPEQGMFVRSDQYPFVRRGIPSVWLSMGFKPADSRIDGQKIVGAYMSNRYHRPSDDMKQQMDFNAAA
jgi:Zn-dependent M28 family amino/carboxypeptidase